MARLARRRRSAWPRIGAYVWGASAGGHLAALAGAAWPVRPARGRRCAGTRSPTSPGSTTTPRTPTRRTFSAARSGSTSTWPAQASPVTHVHAGAPPFLLQHGDADTWVPCEPEHPPGRGAAGVPARRSSWTVVPGADHFFDGSDDVEAIFDRALQFLLAVDRARCDQRLRRRARRGRRRTAPRSSIVRPDPRLPLVLGELAVAGHEVRQHERPHAGLRRRWRRPPRARCASWPGGCGRPRSSAGGSGARRAARRRSPRGRARRRPWRGAPRWRRRRCRRRTRPSRPACRSGSRRRGRRARAARGSRSTLHAVVVLRVDHDGLHRGRGGRAPSWRRLARRDRCRARSRRGGRRSRGSSPTA